jgi:hypothetical protein
MECFRHEGRAAVGCCRSCLRGVCRACAVDLARGLACRDRCEQAVRELIETLDQSVKLRGLSSGILRTTRGLWLGLALVALAVGAFVAWFGYSLPAFREVALLAIPFLAIGAMLLRMARKVGRPEAPAGAEAPRPA